MGEKQPASAANDLGQSCDRARPHIGDHCGLVKHGDRIAELGCVKHRHRPPSNGMRYGCNFVNHHLGERARVQSADPIFSTKVLAAWLAGVPSDGSLASAMPFFAAGAARGQTSNRGRDKTSENRLPSLTVRASAIYSRI